MRWKFYESVLAVLAAFALTPFALNAQMEEITDDMAREAKNKLPAYQKSEYPDSVKKHFAKVCQKGSPMQIFNALRIAEAMKDAKNVKNLIWYSVPAMSEVQRLADVYPVDGKFSAPVRIVMAGDEYEPGSFVLYSFADAGKATLSLTKFVSDEGYEFPADKLDLKVIKVWYQNGNGWYSYFGDTGLKLTPELLLNDEELIKVDTKKV